MSKEEAKDFAKEITKGYKATGEEILPTRQYPTVEEFINTVPILQYDIEGYLTDTRGTKDWSADAIADFSSRIGLATTSIESEILNADENGEGGEWKIHAEVKFVDTGHTEIAEITQPRLTQKTDFKTKEKIEEDDAFSLEKAISRAIRNAKKRAFPAKRLLQMLFDAKKARDDARAELRKQMGAYKEANVSPRELISHAEVKFGIEDKALLQDEWQAKQWNWFKEGITEGAATSTGLFSDLLNEYDYDANEYARDKDKNNKNENVNEDSTSGTEDNVNSSKDEPSALEEQNEPEESNSDSEIPEDYE